MQSPHTLHAHCLSVGLCGDDDNEAVCTHEMRSLWVEEVRSAAVSGGGIFRTGCSWLKQGFQLPAHLTVIGGGALDELHVKVRSRRFHSRPLRMTGPDSQYRRYRSGGARLAVCTQQSIRAMRTLCFDDCVCSHCPLLGRLEAAQRLLAARGCPGRTSRQERPNVRTTKARSYNRIHQGTAHE
jgi:hypothetical protein